jgi:hypothetical protein
LLIASAHFIFKTNHKTTDDFDIWKWSKQALGLTGYLFGWTGFMQNKIHIAKRHNFSSESIKKPIHDSSNFKNNFKRFESVETRN